MKTYILLVGNPGVGKSTVLNGLARQPGLFQSGFHAGGGLTTEFQYKDTGDYVLIDSPGLADAVTREKCAAEVTKALLKGKDQPMKLIFLFKTDAGRIIAQDLSTLQLVLDAINRPNCLKELHVGILFNKCERTELKRADFISINIQTVVHSCGHKNVKFYFFFAPRCEDILDEDNKAWVPDGFCKFLDNDLPSNNYDQVDQVDGRNFQQLQTHFDMKLQEETRKMQKVFDQTKQASEKKIQELKEDVQRKVKEAEMKLEEAKERERGTARKLREEAEIARKEAERAREMLEQQRRDQFIDLVRDILGLAVTELGPAILRRSP